MTKKNLYIIVLLAIIGSIGNSGPVGAVKCEGNTKTWCKLSGLISCFWNEKAGTCYTKKKCNELTMNGECTGTMYEPLNCAWLGTVTNGKCLPKSSVKCKDLAKEQCESNLGSSLQCNWADATQVCKPKKESVCSDFADSQKCTEDKSMSCVWEAGPTVEVNMVTSTKQELKKMGSCKPRGEARCESIGKDKNNCDAEKKRCFWSTKLNHNYCWGKDEKITKCSELKNSLCGNWVYEYLNCTLIGTAEQGSCKLTSEIKCTDLKNDEDCNKKFNSLNCAWVGDKSQGVCKDKKSIKCKDLNWNDCTVNSTFGYLKCNWLQTGSTGICK